MQVQECPACKINPRSHSFEHIATAPNGLRIFYTAPALSEEPETPAKVRNLKIHMDGARLTKWVWVLDCSKMESRHSSSLDFIREISDILSREHSDTLQTIVVLNATLWVRWLAAAARAFVQSDLLEKVVFPDNILCDLKDIHPTSVHAILRRHYHMASSPPDRFQQ
jgi:hypothetical protein